MPALLVCDQIITYDNRDRPRCQTGWIEVDASLVASSPSNSFDITMIDPQTAGLYFGVGFSFIIPVLVLSFAIRKIFQILNWR